MTRHLLCLALLVSMNGAMANEATDPSAPTPTAQLSLDDLRTFTDVFQLLRDNYVDEVGDHALLAAAIDGMVASLDPHSRFLLPEEFLEQDDSAHGRYAGIGVELEVDDGRILVAGVRPDGPARRAGIVTGDLILAVDGTPVAGRPIPESMDAMHGTPGSTVELRLRTKGEAARDLVLERALLPVTSVHAEMLETDLAYVQLNQFHTGSAEEMRMALQHLQEMAPGGRLDGIVLDLRENFGGVVRAAVDIADGFLDEGLVVSARGREPRLPFEFSALPGQWAPGVPLVVLINNHSASASEILAGALQDQHRATLVGQTSFGKGTLQSVLKLRNGAALKLTTARYYTPSGRLIDKVGLEPDVRVGPKTLGGATRKTGLPDEALQRAVEILQEVAG